MQFAEHVKEINKLEKITFGCCRWVFNKPVTNEVGILNIMLKIDQLGKAKVWTPRQWLYIINDMCDYLKMCDVEYKLQYVYPWYNTLLFNLKCLFLMLGSRSQLSFA